MLKNLSLTVLALLAACQTVPDGPSLTERQVAVLKENGFRQVDDHWELGIPDRLLFGIDESKLVPQQVERLQQLSRALTGVGIGGARVEGNTDSTGKADYNRELSLRRAETVKHILVGAGMAPSAIGTSGLGESNPIESNRTASGRRENRRVVIIVSPTDASGGSEPAPARQQAP